VLNGIFLLSWFALFLPALSGSEPGIEVLEKGQGYLFRESGSPILFYQRAPRSIQGAYTRNNYIHPLWNLDGAVLTEDGPEDHPHQRGIYWTWHQVYSDGIRMGDAWECKNFLWDIQLVDVHKNLDGSQTLTASLFWKSPAAVDENGQMVPFVREKTNITVYLAADKYRQIDFEISLTALTKKVLIGGSEDEKGYGGFSARLKMPGDISFYSVNGEVKAETTAVNAGPWLDIHASFGPGEGKSGVAILCHKSNPGPINRWILRRTGSMQNPVYPGRKPVSVGREKPTVLRYRLVVHRGQLTRTELESLYQQYIRSR